MKLHKPGIRLENLREKEEVTERMLNCCKTAGITTVDQLIAFYNENGTFIRMPNCGLITHYKFLKICLKYIQPGDNIDMNDKEFKKILSIYPDLMHTLKYDQKPDEEEATLSNDVRINIIERKSVREKPQYEQKKVVLWSSPLCFWSSVELPGFRYSAKKKAWWKIR